MPVVLVAFAVALSLPWLLGLTFGQQCAKAFERDTPAHERCVQRMDNGGGLHFEKNIVLTPIE